jgi:hypothetical protein
MPIESKCWIDDEEKAHVELVVEIENMEQLRFANDVMDKMEGNLAILEVLKSRDQIEHQIGVALYEEELVANVPDGKRAGHKIMERLITAGTNLESLRKAIAGVSE